MGRSEHVVGHVTAAAPWIASPRILQVPLAVSLVLESRRNECCCHSSQVWINCVLVNVVLCSDVVGSLLNNQDSHRLDINV